MLGGLSVAVAGVGVGALSSVLNASDQSRIGNRQGAFLKVLAWFMGFFTLISLGGTIWWLLSRHLSADVTGLIVLGLTVALSARLVTLAGRRLDKDPEQLLAKLAPVY
jgi:Co/Zn/Cd efflux system component